MLTCRYQKRYVAGVLFFCLNLMPQAYCAQYQGLKIAFSSDIQPNQEIPADNPEPISRLTDIVFRENPGVIEEVMYTLPRNDASWSEPDTDNEEETFLEREKNTRKDDQELNACALTKNVRPTRYNRSRHAPGGQNSTYDSRNNYVKEEVDIDKLRLQLSSHAFDIVGSEPNAQTQKSTVCLCVALRDKHGYIKKFSFHNGESVMSPAMRKKAHELGYDVIQAEQSHAELQFAQFLIRREQVRPGLYTHIMGMGCSRCYCAECDHALKGMLSDEYFKIAAAVDDKKDNSDGLQSGPISATSKPITSDETDSSDAVKFTQSIAQETEYKVVKGEKTVDNATYDRYYVPKSLQKAFDHIAGVAHDFSSSRLTTPKPERVSRRKRG